MKHLLCAIAAISALASCAGPRAYSGTTPAEAGGPNGSAGPPTTGAGGSEPEQGIERGSFSYQNVFSNDYLENERRAWEAWEAGG
jgi:hypothetical protein